jgi:hypothetical protein
MIPSPAAPPSSTAKQGQAPRRRNAPDPVRMRNLLEYVFTLVCEREQRKQAEQKDRGGVGK